MQKPSASIIGRGLIASTLRPVAADLGDAVLFATGTADSSSADRTAYQHEQASLAEALRTCCQRQSRLVFFSSAGKVYGESTGKRSETTPCHPISAYGRHKLDCETLIRSADCRHLIVRLPNLVGPNQNPNQLVPALVGSALSGQVTVYQNATRDLLGVDEFRDIMVQLVGTVADQETIVVASGVTISIEQIVSRIQEILGTTASIQIKPNGQKEEYDISKLRRLAPLSNRFSKDYPLQVLDKFVPLHATDSGR